LVVSAAGPHFCAGIEVGGPVESWTDLACWLVK
jgi:hypothetical protein